MQSRTLIFALLALLIGGGTAYFVHSWLSAQQQPIQVAKAPPPPVGKMVLVAAKNLPAGSFIKPDSVRWQPWPEGAIAPSYSLRGTRNAEDFHGAVVRQGITAGEPITEVPQLPADYERVREFKRLLRARIVDLMTEAAGAEKDAG